MVPYKRVARYHYTNDNNNTIHDTMKIANHMTTPARQARLKTEAGVTNSAAIRLARLEGALGSLTISGIS